MTDSKINKTTGSIALDPDRPEPAALARAADVLREGGLVVFPTETLYGIAADSQNQAALERLAALKGREADKPMALILSGAGEVQRIAELTPAAIELMTTGWPGPLTLVLKALPGLHPALVSADGGVGARLSPHPVAAGLARALGRAITATSANPAGGPAPAAAADLDPAIAGGVDLILDAGPCAGGPPSTVADVRGDKPKLLRQGAVKL